MASPLERTAYRLGLGLRFGVYWGQAWLSDRMTKPVEPRPVATGKLPGAKRLRAALSALSRRDWENIAAGHYRLPHDLVTEPLQALARSRPYFADLAAVERRRHGRVADDLPEDLPHADDYPDYYLQNFHYQTDGYLSAESARLYDHQVEVLFTGTADLMRRQLLVPLKTFMAGRRQADTNLLDLACGTGRFLTFVKDNYPRLGVTALDLSPAYLEQARRNLKPWRDVRFVQGPAEGTGLATESQDIVTIVYLFHELPRAVRRAVLAEAVRLLKPGGQLLFMDSLQLGDEPDFDALLERFPHAFHEPFYLDYIRQDLEALFGDQGLQVMEVGTAYLSRTIIAQKPGVTAGS